MNRYTGNIQVKGKLGLICFFLSMCISRWLQIATMIEIFRLALLITRIIKNITSDYVGVLHLFPALICMEAKQCKY